MLFMYEVERNRKVFVPEYTPGPAVGPGVELSPPRCQSSGCCRCSARCHCSARSPTRRKRKMKKRKRMMKTRSGAFPACPCSGLMAWETIPPPLKPHQASLRSGTQTHPVERERKEYNFFFKNYICRRTILSNTLTKINNFLGNTKYFCHNNTIFVSNYFKISFFYHLFFIK